MSVSVGGVTVQFDGDANGAVAAMKAVAQKLDELVAKERDLKAALDAATAAGVADERAMSALRTAHRDASVAVDRLTGKLDEQKAAENASATAAKAAADAAKAAEKARNDEAKSAEKLAAATGKAADGHGVLGAKARRVDEVMGTLQTSVGGVASAFGVQGQAMTDIIGGVADVAKSMGTGGPLLAATVVAGAAMAALAGHFEKAAERARTAYKKIVDETSKMSDQLKQDIDNLETLRKESQIGALTAGLTAEQTATVRMFIDTADAEKALRDFEARFGLMAANVRGPLAQTVPMTRDRSRSPQEVLSGAIGDPGFAKYADTLVDIYARLQEKVRATISAGNAAVGQAAAEKSADDAADAMKGPHSDAMREAILDLSESLRLTTKTDLSSAQPDFVPKLTTTMDLSDVEVVGGDAGAYESPEGFLKLQQASSLAAAGLVDYSITLDSTDGYMVAAGENIARLSDDVAEFDLAMADVVSSTRGLAGAISDAITGIVAAAGDIVVAGIEGGAAGAGSALGSVAGTVVGELVAPGGGGAIGGALGGALGDLLGGTLDALIESLGILAPLFDAITLIIGALEPILMVLAGLFISVADTLISMIPLITNLSRGFAAGLALVVRIVQMILPFVDMIVLAITGIFAYTDSIVDGAVYLDEHFFKPLAEGAARLYNGFVTFYNRIIQIVRDFTGNQEWGTKAEQIDVTRGMIGADDKTGAATAKEEARRRRESDEQGIDGAAVGAATGEGMKLTNVPSGFKALNAIYEAADAESRGPPSAPGDLLDGRGVVINIENWNSRGDANTDVEVLRRMARHGHRAPQGTSRRFGDNKN